MKKTFTIAVSVLVLASGAALAGHGKQGLWTVSSTMKMANMPQIPPEAMAMMKQRGIKMPGMGEPTVSQMCMTQDEVNADMPPRMSREGENCENHVLSKTGSSISVDMVCSGRMKGTGHLQVTYSGAEHYMGSYSFKGTAEGHPADMTTDFKADWVKADCGAVKPFVHPPK